MLDIVLSNQFRKDLKLVTKRGYNLQLLNQIVDTLAQPKSLPLNNRDHNLSGNYSHFRECHITPDWLLIYRIDPENSTLFLARTGTHSDLFR